MAKKQSVRSIWKATIAISTSLLSPMPCRSSTLPSIPGCQDLRPMPHQANVVPLEHVIVLYLHSIPDPLCLFCRFFKHVRPRTSVHIPVAKFEAWVSLKTAPVTSTETSVAAFDQSTSTTISHPPTMEVSTQVVGATVVDPPVGHHPAPVTRKKKDKGLMIVDLSNEVLGKRAWASIIRS